MFNSLILLLSEMAFSSRVFLFRGLRRTWKMMIHFRLHRYFCVGIDAFFVSSFPDFPSQARASSGPLALIRSSGKSSPQPSIVLNLKMTYNLIMII